MHPRILMCLIGLSLLLASAAPAAARSLGPVPSSVRAGDFVELRWSGLPTGVDELEIELSLDGGGWRRISPELDADRGGYRWRVPMTSSRSARLRLRVGGEGFERELECSEPFAIRAPDGDRRPPREPLSGHESAGRRSARDLRTGDPSLSSSNGRTPLVEPRRIPLPAQGSKSLRAADWVQHPAAALARPEPPIREAFLSRRN